ncbi:carbohydrate kinase family protein [Pseudonocardia xinjiangensis]|uniref:Carbohydrate kinase n=1 Tax=Pseudonocardia xinjiangensis TaxID=75289 RepID=A0ABX1RG74_9PSEU|nr:carbohydrate kinase [Pseudonocardia xinjiangensis]NMH78110.1 carbohydrate kinase [Pseudonocardia xinjiangensis]
MFVVVGEALVDLVGQRGSRTLVAHPGGSPANVALGLARLGDEVTLMTRLGRDALGEMVAAHLRAGGVHVESGTDRSTSTSLAIATLAAGIATYDFRIEWDIDALEPLPIETRCLHTGSLATALTPGSRNVEDLMEREQRRGRVTISYDPNVRPALLGSPHHARPGIERLVGLSDVVKVSDEDLLWLYPDRRDEDVAREWLGRGPALVVVTRGGRGVHAVTANLELRRPAQPIDLVDTVGAGDSFTSGLLDGLRRADLIGGSRRAALAAVDESTLLSVVDAAALVAAITCSRPGADPPTRTEVDAAADTARSSTTATAPLGGSRGIAPPGPELEQGRQR